MNLGAQVFPALIINLLEVRTLKNLRDKIEDFGCNFGEQPPPETLKSLCELC